MINPTRVLSYVLDTQENSEFPLTKVFSLIFVKDMANLTLRRCELMLLGKRIAEKMSSEKISFLRKSSNIHRESGNYLGFGDERAELNSEI